MNKRASGDKIPSEAQFFSVCGWFCGQGVDHRFLYPGKVTQMQKIGRFSEENRPLFRGKAADLWSCYPDLNRRPHPYQGCALPTELQQRMATRKGLEPSTSGVTGRRSNQLNYRAIFLSKDSGRCNLSWQGQKDSNPRHSVLETDALPAELYP